MPNREERLFRLRSGKRAKQFAVSLKTNARRMEQFLRGD